MTMRRLDRIVSIEERVFYRDRFGSQVETWVNLDDVWASVRLTGVREQYITNADRERAVRNAIIRIRWRDDLHVAGHRIVYEQLAWDILGQDEIGYRRYLDLTCQAEIGGEAFLPQFFNIRGGLSADSTPQADEITIGHDGGRITFPAFGNMHVILWRDDSEPDISTVVFQSDITRENQFIGFTQAEDMNGNPLKLRVDGALGNVWVSNQLLTFTEPMVIEVA